MEVNSSYDGTGNSPAPSAARTRGRVTGTRRPPRVTEPRSRPWRTAVRAWSCLPFGPASAVTSASINACITCRPAPTANASRPSCMFSAISVIATLTRSGNAVALHGLDLATLLHGGPLAVGVSWRTPDTYHTAGLERGTATSTSTRPGTTSESAQRRSRASVFVGAVTSTRPSRTVNCRLSARSVRLR